MNFQPGNDHMILRTVDDINEMLRHMPAPPNNWQKLMELEQKPNTTWFCIYSNGITYRLNTALFHEWRNARNARIVAEINGVMEELARDSANIDDPMFLQYLILRAQRRVEEMT